MRSAILLLLTATAASAAPRVTADRDRVVLGDQAEVTLRVESAVPLRSSASSGQLQCISSSGGEQVFRWTAPDLRYPTHAVLLFWEAASPMPDVAAVDLQLLGRTVIEMDTEPFASVSVRVGGETFGPVKANAHGRVKVPVEVPPGVRSAEAIAVARGQRTSRTVPLEVPKTTPFAIAAGPLTLREGEHGWLLAASSPDASASNLKAHAEGARIESASHSEGREVWTVAPQTGASSVQLTVGAAGAGGERHTIALGAAAAQEVTVPSSIAVSRVTPQLLAGVFYGGGANVGPMLELSAGMKLSVFPNWLTVELATGARRATLSGNPDGLGGSTSTLWAVPLELGARGRVLRADPFALDLRAGAGPLFFRHSFDASFQPAFTESGVGFEAFGGAEGAWRLGPVEALLEVRGSFARVRTPHLIAHPGGLGVMVGARWVGR